MTAKLATKILHIGASYGGVGALKTFLQLTEKLTEKKLELYVIDPRAGFINVLAIPKTIMDVQFAKDTFVELYDYGIIWDSIKVHHDSAANSPDVYKKVLRKYTNATHHYGLNSEKLQINDNVKLHFIQGHVTKLHPHSVEYSTGRNIKQNTPPEFAIKDGEENTIASLDFDYCIIGSGRGRNWPFDPIGSNKDEFTKEMEHSLQSITNADKISVIGGGALGIEIAGELKHYFHGSKSVQLIHPHEFLPPETLISSEFKTKVIQKLEESKVVLKMNSRVKEIDNKLVVTKKDEDNVPLVDDLTYWCNYHKNNIQFIQNSPDFPCQIAHKDEIAVSDYLEVKKSDTEVYEHIFAVGDLVDLPIIKTAGGAFRAGNVAATNIYESIINNSKEKYTTMPLDVWPKHSMVLTIGCDTTIYANPDGKVTLNDQGMLNIYKDYRNENIYAFNSFRIQNNPEKKTEDNAET